MKIYEISFSKNHVYQSNLVRTNKSPVEIGLWFKEKYSDIRVTRIAIATVDSMKPGKPFITL